MATTSGAKPGPGKAQKKGASQGRVTKKGPQSGRYTPPEESGRYTAPVPKNVKTSPKWMGVLVIALFILGLVIVLLNYAKLLPGSASNWYLLAGIASVFAGLMVATRYH